MLMKEKWERKKRLKKESEQKKGRAREKRGE